MFLNTSFARIARAARFAAVMAILSAAAVPVALSVGVDGAAQAQSRGGGGGGGKGGGGGGDGGDNRGPSSVLKCLGAACIDVTKQPCTAGAACEDEKPRGVRYTKDDSCRIQVCDVIHGEKVCWLDRPYDVRLCQKKSY